MPTQQPAHSDTIHFNSRPPGFMAGVWVALEDADMDNGPLFYYPGSQKLPEVTMQDVGVEADYSQYPHYEDYIRKLVAEHGLEPEYALIKKGQALIWSANLLHGGTPANDPDAHPPQPGDALLLRGHALLHARSRRRTSPPRKAPSGASPSGSPPRSSRA